MGWPGFFRVFTVLCAIMLLLAQECQGLVTAGSGSWQVLSVYEGLTSWTVPALFMLWGMFSLEEGKQHVSASLLGLALPAFFLLVFWGAAPCPGAGYGPPWCPPQRGTPTFICGCSTPSWGSTWSTR